MIELLTYSYPIYHLSSLSIYSLNEDATSETSVSSESDSVQQAQISATEVNMPKSGQQLCDSERLPSQQQSPMAAPATEHQPIATSSATGQLAIDGEQYLVYLLYPTLMCKG